MYIGEKPKTLQESFERIKSAWKKLIDEYDYCSEDYFFFNSPATENEIAELESAYKLKLPEDYKEFLRFANGAQIMGNSCTIYGTHMFGVRDPMVPDEFYTVGETIGDGERIALNPEDGELYSCYNGEIEPFSFEWEMCHLVKECEENVIECEKKIAEEKKTPEQKQKDAEEYAAFIAELDRLIEEAKNRNKNANE